MSEEDLRNEIRSMIGFDGDRRITAKMLAAEWRISEAYLSDVLNGRRGIADKLANALGYQRIVTFQKASK